MDCLNSNCSVSGTDRMVACWLCLGNYHMKCSGLKARDVDALADPVKSLQWTCPRCKLINIEFYKFLKSYKEEFDHINTDFLLLQSKLSKFGELYSSFPNLEKFVDTQTLSSPKKKKTTNKSATLPIIRYSSVPTPVNIIEIDKADDTPIVLPLNPVSAVSPSIEIDSRPTTPFLSPLMSPNSEILESNILITPRELRTIPPRKTIFATRFINETTVEDIKNYIMSKYNNVFPNNILVYKINSRNRASFKVIVPEELFAQILDPNFWPKHTLVREFIYRQEILASIPNSANNNQKN